MAKRTSQSLMQKIFADADERRYKAIYYVAKEVSGRALSRVHKQGNRIKISSQNMPELDRI